MFELRKVLLNKFGGLEISYIKDEEENPIEYKTKSISAPHPDLTNILKGLVYIVAESFLMLPELLDDRNILDRIRVTGVEYASGNSVIIHFNWIAKNNTETKLVSPRIRLESNAFGFESELATKVERLASETELYITGKRAQMSLFGQSDDYDVEVLLADED